MLQFIIEDVNSVNTYSVFDQSLMVNRLKQMSGYFWFLIWVLSMEFIIMLTEDYMDKFGDILEGNTSLIYVRVFFSEPWAY